MTATQKQTHPAKLTVILARAGLLLTATLLSASCTFKKNQPDHPYPSEARSSKAFFETTDAQGRARLKTFIAGWSPEMSAGSYSDEVFVHYNHAEHTNLVFDIQEDKLVGKMIVPSFIDKDEDCLLRDSAKAKACRDRWPNVVTIPISSHFYYERQKDSRGRDSDTYIENSTRSHWSARPNMNLELGRIKINDWALDIMWRGHEVDSVTDIEWDDKTGYMAFTLEAHSINYYAGSNVQGKFRFNFVEFKHDEKFTPTPFRHSNAKHINILHVIGKQIDGDPTNPVLYAAHWDTKKEHTIWLHGFPQEYEQIGRDVIEEWNDAFDKVGQGRPFKVDISKRKYAFDLRYPTITWVDDRRLSASAPLGVGMALADVRNGEIRWGGVTVWGGMLQEYINRSSPNAAAAGLVSSFARKPIIQLSLMEPTRLLPSTRLAVPETLLGNTSFEANRSWINNSYGAERAAISDLLKSKTAPQLLQLAQAGTADDAQNSEGDLVDNMADSLAQPESLKAQDVIDALVQREKALAELPSLVRKQSGQPIVDEMAEGLTRIGSRMNLMATQVGPLEKIYGSDFIQGLIGMPKLSESMADLPMGNAREFNRMMAEGRTNLSKQEMMDHIRDSELETKTGIASFCTDRRLFQQLDAYNMGIAEANVDKVAAMRSVIKDLLLHEVGHMLGLGHNFKENILPKRGTLPNVSEKVGFKKGEVFKMDKLEADAKNLNRNYTTVMGYKDGAVDVIMDYKDINPGPGDILSLHYLYNQQYPIYPVDGKGEGDFEFKKLDSSGWILDTVNQGGKTYRPAYFPACNDFVASRGNDPYCARWDRGYDASTIVQNHFTSFRGNMISQLTAFTDTVKGDSFWMHEYYLWYRSLNTFSRVRVFYDYMRQTYDAEIRKMIASGAESGTQNLLQFSETCVKMHDGKPTDNAYLKTMFEANPELLDLCYAGHLMVDELGQLMQLPGKDYTWLDYGNRFASWGGGGEAKGSFGRAFGSWKELARVPIKFSSLLTLTSPYAYSQWGGWAVPITEFSRQDSSYHISTLYAKEYTAAIATGTEMNLNLENTGFDESSSIGRTVLAMGNFLYNTWFSNDVLTVGAPFVQDIRNQTKFRYSYAIIDVEKDIEEEGKQIARRFTGTIYNQYQRGPEKVPELYIYTNGRIVMRPPPGSLLMPVTAIRWYSKTAGYFYAIKMDYEDEFFDNLKTNSVRRTLNENYQEVVKNCIQGPGDTNNGLRYFFNKDVSEKVFPGFEFPDKIAEREELKNDFFRSVQTQFQTYYAGANGHFSVKPTPSQCDEAIRGQSLIVMAASVLNGYYFFDIYDYLEKGN